jgi:NitT/TauT family transport system permease protein
MRIPKWLAKLVWPLGVAVVAICIWDVVVRFSELPRIVLPSPIEVASLGWENRHLLIAGFWQTGKATACGLLTSVGLGTLTAILFSQSANLRRAFYPYVIFLQTVPIVAIAPLLIIWSGYNFRTIVMISTIVSIFPIVANVTSGLLSIDSDWEDLFRLNNASRWQILTKLRIPAAVAFLIVGMRIACGLAVIGAIIGEYFVGSANASYKGLGAMMSQWQAGGKTPELMSAVLVSTILGVAFFSLINVLGNTLLKRWTIASQFENSGSR